MKQLKTIITNKYALYGLGILLFFSIWEIISLIVGDKTLLFPDPFVTFAYVGTILKTKYLYQSIGSTMLRMLIGFGFSLIAGIIVGTIAGEKPALEKIFQPTMTALKSIPTASIVFLFLIISGARFAPVYIVALISFPIMYESVVGGIKNIPDAINNALALEKKSKIIKILRVKLPMAFPYILVGISSSFALSFKIEIMAEIITGDTKPGLGSAIFVAQRNDPTNMVPIFAYSLIAILFMLLITLLNTICKQNVQKIQIKNRHVK